MKKLVFILSVLSVLAFTSCKKAGDKMKDAANTTAGAVTDGANAVGDAANAGVDAAGNAVDAGVDAAGNLADSAKNLMGADFTVPTFDNPDLNQWAQDFMSSAVGLQQATNESPEALNAATEKFNELNKKLADFRTDPQFKQAAEFAQTVGNKILQK